MSSYSRGIVLVTAAAFCWSLAGILVRLLSVDPWTILFWRSAFMCLTLAVFLGMSYRFDIITAFRRIGWLGAVLALSFAITFGLFIIALSLTTVANTVVIMSATPLIAALAGRLILGERLTAATAAAITAAGVGIALMFADSLGGGGLWGNLCALGVAATQAFNLLLLRRARTVDMVPAVCLAGLIAAVAALPLAAPLAVTAADLAVLAVLGTVQVGLGLVLFTIGVRYIPVAQASLLGLLETVLSPLWTWLGVGETPAPLALAGGAIVVATLSVIALRSVRAR